MDTTLVRLRHYQRARKAGYPPVEALCVAKTRVRFDLLAEADHVRLRRVEDPEPYRFGNVEDEDATRALIERFGLWGICADQRCPACQCWIEVDSCWGYVGTPEMLAMADHDAMLAAVHRFDRGSVLLCDRCEDHAEAYDDRVDVDF